MTSENKIAALLNLVDDPDYEVFDTVANQLMHYGKNIIPKLEQLWEVTASEEVQNRIENLIHRVHFRDLQSEFKDWARDKSAGLLSGAILLAKYKYPELDATDLLKQFEQIKRNVWLELNNYLTPLEQVNVVNSVLFNFYKFEGFELSGNNIDLFFLNYLLESKKGNAFSLGIIYLAVCEMVDVPLLAIDLPRQFVLAYFDNLYPFFSSEEVTPVQQIQFFLDPMNAMVYTRKDVEVYLKKINAPSGKNYFVPLNNKQVIIKMLEEMLLCYEHNNRLSEADEMHQLLRIAKVAQRNG